MLRDKRLGLLKIFCISWPHGEYRQVWRQSSRLVDSVRNQCYILKCLPHISIILHVLHTEMTASWGNLGNFLENQQFHIKYRGTVRKRTSLNWDIKKQTTLTRGVFSRFSHQMVKHGMTDLCFILIMCRMYNQIFKVWFPVVMSQSCQLRRYWAVQLCSDTPLQLRHISNLHHDE
jgi:hypothetical protein